jgi:hypothetical protein
MKVVKQKACRICKSKFTPWQTTAVVCSPGCALELVGQKKKKEFDRETKRLKDKIKTKAQWAKEAQQAFNRFIRARDADKGCICCNNKHYSGQYHAGHWLSVGSHPELRFNEDNCHKQKSSCNSYKSGNQINYRKYLIKKIGLERVEALEGPHEPNHYDIDDLQIIKRCYNRKAKELEDNQI